MPHRRLQLQWMFERISAVVSEKELLTSSSKNKASSTQCLHRHSNRSPAICSHSWPIILTDLPQRKNFYVIFKTPAVASLPKKDGLTLTNWGTFVQHRTSDSFQSHSSGWQRNIYSLNKPSSDICLWSASFRMCNWHGVVTAQLKVCSRRSFQISSCMDANTKDVCVLALSALSAAVETVEHTTLFHLLWFHRLCCSHYITVITGAAL